MSVRAYRVGSVDKESAPVWRLFGLSVDPDGEACLYGRLGGKFRQVLVRLWFGLERSPITTKLATERLVEVLGGRVEYAGGNIFRLDEGCLRTICGWQAEQGFWSDWEKDDVERDDRV